jgi:hypothetical protein
MSTGIAKPIPALAPEGEKIAVLTPIRRPAESRRGPPEFPGFYGSVGLNHVRDFTPRTSRQPTLERTDHARRQRLIKPERVADGEGPLTNL